MKSKYKIIDEKGETVAKGFRNKVCAAQMLPGYKLCKKDKLEIVGENE